VAAKKNEDKEKKVKKREAAVAAEEEAKVGLALLYTSVTVLCTSAMHFPSHVVVSNKPGRYFILYLCDMPCRTTRRLNHLPRSNASASSRWWRRRVRRRWQRRAELELTVMMMRRGSCS
jgi:hypothetical protein